MSLRLDHLSLDRLDAVHRVFLEAFSEYQVDVGYMTAGVLRNRAIKNGISWEHSVGAFDGDEIAAFTLIGVGPWGAETAAFDIATGIVPRFRGQGLAGRIFDFALPGLRARGVTRFILEVIRTNEAAIRAYEKAGFRKERSFDCYRLGEAVAARGIASALLARAIRDSRDLPGPLKVLNVLEGDRATGGCLRRAGFRIYTRQHEMHRRI